MSTSDSVSALPFVFVDYAIAPIAALAKDIIAADKPNPSDLSSYTIWSESRAEIHSIKLNLIKAGKAAGIHHLLLPNIITLQDWVWQQDTTDKHFISETNKQLLLVEAIRQSPTLFQTNNAWPLANELVSLFNECTLAQIPLQEGEQALRDLLHDCYQFPTANAINISRESEIVYRLWQAYREQIEAREWIDPVDYYCQWLVNVNNSHLQTEQQYFLVGKHRLCAAEVIFLQKAALTNNVSIYSPRVSPHQHGAYLHPHVRFLNKISPANNAHDSREQALDIIFDRTHHTYDRIGQLKATIPNNIFNHWLSIYTCNSIENHIIAVSLQAKKWLTEGISSIGIVVNDRLLARRIRAVLEEQGIQPTDLGGWTLSTTSAATSIEVLLDAIEHNFKKDPLLDLLSNPFLPGNHSNDTSFTYQTYEFRKHLKKHRNTATDNLDAMTELAMQHFASQNSACKELSETLAILKSACSSLQKSKDFGEHEIYQLSDNLITTLKDLGIYETLASDIAGKQLIEVFHSHTQNTRNNSIKITWEEWRQWLRDLLENNYFIPGNTDKRATLCGFEHTDNMQFQAVIIAGVEENRLTNTKSHRTFFNEKVCHELHLPTNYESNAINFVRFRQLLQQCDTVLLSAETEIRGEAQELSSWAKLINLFCEQSYASSTLDNTELSALTQAYKQYKHDKYNFTNYKTMQPQPSAPAELIPKRVSATQYQSLMDCPYQYFAKYVLELRDLQTADDFEASDYGMLVHKSLYDFHFSSDNKTDLAFSLDNRHSLIEQLTDLSTSVFMHAAFPPTIKQAWLQRWITNIPAYIQWAIKRAEDWRALRGESPMQRHFIDEFSIYGKVDRIDSDTKHLAVTDYKTGSTIPSKKNVMSGEVVQLPFYALLDENIAQAEYLSLGTQGEVKTTALLNEEELTQLKAEHQPRLENLLSALLNGATLSAQGDDNTCRVCDYQGLCRKQHWN